MKTQKRINSANEFRNSVAHYHCGYAMYQVEKIAGYPVYLYTWWEQGEQCFHHSWSYRYDPSIPFKFQAYYEATK